MVTLRVQWDPNTGQQMPDTFEKQTFISLLYRYSLPSEYQVLVQYSDGVGKPEWY